MITMLDELYHQYVYEKSEKSEYSDLKDIIIVVHDQLDYIKECIESLYSTTKNFRLYLWDNNSMQPTKEYLEQMSKKYDNITLVRHSRNIGFIIPNNKLAKLGISPYIILLNSDTVVSKGWDSALIGVLNAYPNCGIIGFQGGTLEIDGKGCGGSLNGKIDYVCGWCLCIKRILYEKFGLFDEDNLKFAYGEDSDLSLRMKEEGFDIHAMNIKLVKHYGNVTSMEVNKEMDISATFKKNHEYIRERWKDYLMYKRVALTP